MLLVYLGTLVGLVLLVIPGIYLSLAWIRELTREVDESESLAQLATEHSIGVTQVVSSTVIRLHVAIEPVLVTLAADAVGGELEPRPRLDDGVLVHPLVHRYHG